jgi:hypothetical protein
MGLIEPLAFVHRHLSDPAQIKQSAHGPNEVIKVRVLLEDIKLEVEEYENCDWL